MDVLTDSQIQAYLNETKIIPKGIPPNLRDRGRNYGCEISLKGLSGNNYKIIIKVSKKNPLDFSIILGLDRGNNVFRLKRNNGDHGIHTNKIEKNKVDGFHIHLATERYQLASYREEGYAIPTSHYFDWKTAYQAMIRETNIIEEIDNSQTRLTP